MEIADLESKGYLSDKEFEFIWHHLNDSIAIHERAMQPTSVGKFECLPEVFQFGTREHWKMGLSGMLENKVQRSIESECTRNDEGKWAPMYEYIVSQPAKEQPVMRTDPRSTTA